MLRSTSMSACAFVSTTCYPSRFPLGPSTTSVQLDACASSPIYLSIGVLLSGSGNSVPGETECVRFQRRTRASLQADQNPDRVRRSRTPCPYDAYPVS